MNTRDQFGNYLLLKKLSEDALGETFRAGKLGKQGVERVILLRVFNGQGLDGEKLAQRIQARAPLQQALKSPNLGLGLDLGQVRGVPYVAYDYISGKTLAQLLEQAAKKHSPIPLDHALLMTERIALGLAVAYETRIGEERVQHGFLTPHLVIVSNEGELRLLGFEASNGLREAANHPLIKQSAGRYLAPEVLAGSPPAKADDVYSLGAILFELLTGRALPVSTAGGQAALIDQAVIAADGGNLHPELANLLKRSLVPREQRIGDAVTWHKTLAKMMFEGQYNPTTFNLAFFMHNLFREEIERETQELELEKTTAIPVQAVQAAASAPPKAQAPTFGQSGGGTAARESSVREETQGGRERQGMESKPAKNNSMMIAAGVGALLVLGGLGYFMFGRGSAPAAPASDAPLSSAPADTAAAPAGPTPEEIQAQIQKIVDDKMKSSSAQYEDKLKTLQKQLDDAKKAQEQRAAAAANPAPKPVTIPSVPAPTAPAAAAVAEPTAPAPAPADSAASTTPPPTTPAEPEAKPAAPVENKAAAVPVRPAGDGTVRPGDLVTMGAGVSPPKVARRASLRYPPLAQRMKKEATVTVRVLVDETGRAADVQATGSSVGFGMDEAAMDYARGCAFTPATKNGVPVRMWMDLKVAFNLTGG
ncbi:MAG: TonB family protein [Thermoanaerobaculia bacterium]